MDDLFPVTRHRYELDVFYRMAELGMFGEDDRIELIDGDVIDLPGRRLLIHRSSGSGVYADVAMHRPGAALALAAAPEIVLDMDGLFP